LEKKAEQILPGSEGIWGGGRGWRGWERMVAQIMHTHMNKCINNKK
jgi:hypothetical protein